MAKNPTPSNLDPGQIIKRAFNDSDDSLRVDAQITANISAAQEVIISAVDDSIRLADVNGNNVGVTGGALNVNITGGSSSGTQYADGVTQSTPTGTAVLGKNGSNVLHTLSLDSSGNLNVNLAAGSISGGNAAASPTGSAVPASADYTGFNSGGSLVGVSTANPLPVAQQGNVTVNPLTNSSLVKAQLQDNAGTAITVGQKAMASSVPVVLSSDQAAIPVSQNGTWNITNVSGTVSLPTNAATGPKQDTGNTSLASIDTKTPALGQALAAASVPIVLTAAQLTTLTPVTTVTANAGSNLNTSALALDATLTGGTAKTVVRGGTKGTTSAADVTSTASGVNHQPIDVAIYDASGNQITSFGGGTQYADGTARGTATGTLMMGDDGTNIQSVSVDTAGKLNINSVANLDVALSTRLKPADTLAAVTTLGAITNVVHVDDNAGSLTVDNAGTFAVQATLGAETTKVIGTVNIAAAQTIAVTESGTWTVQPGNTANTTPWLVKPHDGTNAGTIKAASTAAAATDTALVVAVSPNNTIASTQSGTWTVQPGNTANTTPWLATARVVGNTGAVVDSADNATTPANAILTSGLYNTTIPALTSGNAGALRIDSTGASYCNTEGRKQTYSVAVLDFATLASSTNPSFSITGSGTKTIRIVRIGISATAATGGVASIILRRFSALSGGTAASQAANIGKHDTNNASATAVVNTWSAIATTATSSGILRTLRFEYPTPAVTVQPQLYEWAFGDKNSQSLVLRGTSDFVGLCFSAIATTPASELYVEWTEE